MMDFKKAIWQYEEASVEDLYQAFKKRLLEELAVPKERLLYRNDTKAMAVFETEYIPLHDKTAEKKD